MRGTVILLLLGLVCCTSSRSAERRDDPVQVRLIAFNDFHGNLRPPRKGRGGAAYFAAHVAKARAEASQVVVVSAGDLIGGSPLISALLHDEPAIELMNHVGLDIHGVGNHEFDEGADELLRMKRGGCHQKDGCNNGTYPGAKFSFLAANVHEETAPIFPPYEVRTFDGIPIAFIGMTLEDTPAFLPPMTSKLAFHDEVETVERLLPELEGVEAIVVILHEGGIPGEGGANDCKDLSGAIVEIAERLSPRVDVVVSGHTHRAYNCRLSGKAVTSAGCFGEMITTIDLTLDPVTKDVVRVDAKNRAVDHSLAPDPEVEAMVARYAELVRPLEERIVGAVSAPLTREKGPSGESSLGGVIADAQLAATRSAGAQVALMNSGGIRTDLGTESKQINYGMAFSVQPFGNVLVTMTLTGAELHDILEQQWGPDRVRFLQVSSTLRYAWREGRSRGDHVDPGDITIDGAPLALEKTYRVTANNYLAYRGVFAKGREATTGVLDLEALAAYLEAQAPVGPPKTPRIRRLP